MKSKWLTRLPFVALAGLSVACGGGGEKSTPVTKTAAPTHDAAAPAAPAEPAAADEAAEVSEYTVMAVTDGGKVSGKVTFSGAAPEGELLPIVKDPTACGTEKTILNVKVGAGGVLQDAVVYLAEIKQGKAFAESAATVDQKNCEYTPHVQAMTAGGKIEVINSDPVLHNIHAYGDAGAKSLFNLAQPNGAKPLSQKLKKAGPVAFKCDVHSWMHAWVFVSPHPYYAVTGADGTFSIGEIPAGEYTVKVWHEELGEKEMKVSVTAGGDAMTDVVYGG